MSYRMYAYGMLIEYCLTIGNKNGPKQHILASYITSFIPSRGKTFHFTNTDISVVQPAVHWTSISLQLMSRLRHHAGQWGMLHTLGEM